MSWSEAGWHSCCADLAETAGSHGIPGVVNAWVHGGSRIFEDLDGNFEILQHIVTIVYIHRCRMNRAANFTRVREHRRDTSVMRIAKFSYSQGCGWTNSERRYYKYRKYVAPPGNRPSLSRFFSRISGRGSNHIWQHHRILLMYPINLVSYSEFHLFWLSHLAKAASTCGR
jgi:hypothetical protein